MYIHWYCCSLPLSAFPDGYSKDLYKAHTEEIYNGLLIHLDDPSSEIQVRYETNNVLVSFCILDSWFLPCSTSPLEYLVPTALAEWVLSMLILMPAISTRSFSHLASVEELTVLTTAWNCLACSVFFFFGKESVILLYICTVSFGHGTAFQNSALSWEYLARPSSPHWKYTSIPRV